MLSAGSVPPDLFFGVALPLVWGGLFWTAAFPVWGRKSRPELVLLAILLPFLFAVAGLREVPPFPPLAAEGWLFYLAILPLVAHAFASGFLGGRGTSYLLPAVGSLIVAGVCVFPLYQSTAFDRPTALKTGAILAGLSFFHQSCLSTVSSRGKRESAWLGFILAASLAGLLVMSSSAYLGLLVATFAAAIGPSLGIGLIRKDLYLPTNAAGPLGMMLSACAAQGYLYAYMRLECALLFAAVPGLLAFGPGRLRFLGAVCFVFLALLLAAISYFQL